MSRTKIGAHEEDGELHHVQQPLRWFLFSLHLVFFLLLFFAPFFFTGIR